MQKIKKNDCVYRRRRRKKQSISFHRNARRTYVVRLSIKVDAPASHLAAKVLTQINTIWWFRSIHWLHLLLSLPCSKGHWPSTVSLNFSFFSSFCEITLFRNSEIGMHRPANERSTYPHTLGRKTFAWFSVNFIWHGSFACETMTTTTTGRRSLRLHVNAHEKRVDIFILFSRLISAMHIAGACVCAPCASTPVSCLRHTLGCKVQIAFYHSFAILILWNLISTGLFKKFQQ